MNTERDRRGPATTALRGLCGLLAALAALGAAELGAALVRPQSGPLIAVGSTMIDHTPEWLKEFAIRQFGTHDKQVLLLGIGVGAVVAAILVGLVTRYGLRWGVAGIAAFGALGAYAALTRPTATPPDAVPSVIGALVGCPALTLLTTRLNQVSRDSSSGSRRAESAPATPAGPVGAQRANLEPRNEHLVEAADPYTAANHDPAPEQSRRPSRQAGDGRSHDPAQQAGVGRRGFVVAAAGVGVGAAVAGGAGRVLAGRKGVAAARRGVRLPGAASPAAALPSGADLRIPGLSRFVTANRDFYRVDTALVLPQVDPSSWVLRVHGLVDRPLELSFDDLLRRPLVERFVTLTCVSNEVGGPYVGNARWLGVALADVLGEAGVRRGADQILSRSADGMTISTPIAAVLDGRDALLAVGMNGEPLPVAHGFPARMVVPGLYGYVSATKWVVDLVVTRFTDSRAYWTVRGWADHAPIKTMARIDVPKPLASLKSGRTAVAGVAWAQHRGIAAVEVRVDGGPWRRAQLAPVPGTDTWRQWVLEWDAAPGQHRIEARATDATGLTQPQQRLPPFPNGATGWQSTVVTVT